MSQGPTARAGELFRAARLLTPAGREAYLKTHCGENETLGKELSALLAASSQFPSIDQIDGRRIGVYILVREIGRGGMGAVYQAVRADGEFQQCVAIKLIKRGMDSDAILLRFRQERHILARLDHPAIARLLDGGTTPEGQPYLVMDFVDGGSLIAYSEPLSIIEKLELFLAICDGVQHAHHNRIVHRDLKPANILVSKDGHPKLLDFGIAKWLDPDMAPEAILDTRTGLYMLTPDYASPEQARNQSITERTDVYALGLILFELLTGERAQRCTSRAPSEVERVVCEIEIELPSAVVARESPAATGLRRDLAGNLDAIVKHAVAKLPEHRYASVDDLAADIRAHLDGQPISAGKDRPFSSLGNRMRLSLAVAAILVIAVTAWFVYRRNQPPVSAPIDSIAVLPFVNLSSGSGEDALSEGLTEELITELAAMPGIKVPGRAAVWQYKGKRFDVRDAGRGLAVAAVLEGSVRRSEKRVRVVAQLVSVQDGFHLWAQSYDRPSGDSLQVQREISRIIAEDIRSRLAQDRQSERKVRPQINQDAQRAYLEGYQLFDRDEIANLWTTSMPPRMQAAIDAFERATKADPDYALGWAALAEATEWAARLNDKEATALRRRAEAAARRAVELEPANPLALITLGNIFLTHDWDVRTAEPFLRNAVDRNPGNLSLIPDYAYLLIVQGRLKEAVELLQRAEILEPHSVRVLGQLAQLEAARGNCRAALGHANAALGHVPTYRHALYVRAYCDEHEGKNAAAENGYRAALKLHPADDRTGAALGSLLARTGKQAEAKDIAQKLHAKQAQGRRREVWEAQVRLALGDRQAALTLLEQAWTRRDGVLLLLPLDARFQPLANEPRYQALMTRLAAIR